MVVLVLVELKYLDCVVEVVVLEMRMVVVVVVVVAVSFVMVVRKQLAIDDDALFHLGRMKQQQEIYLYFSHFSDSAPHLVSRIERKYRKEEVTKPIC